MSQPDLAAAKAAVTKRFAERFPDGRFAEDFAETLVEALADLGIAVAPPAPSPASSPQGQGA